MKKILLSLFSIALLSLPVTVQACSGCPAGAKNCPMGMSDGSKAKETSGKVQASTFFERADTNKDGSLSRDEFAAARKTGWNKKKDCPISSN